MDVHSDVYPILKENDPQAVIGKMEKRGSCVTFHLFDGHELTADQIFKRITADEIQIHEMVIDESKGKKEFRIKKFEMKLKGEH